MEGWCRVYRFGWVFERWWEVVGLGFEKMVFRLYGALDRVL